MVKVSIIVPVYNVEGFLEKCLRSLVRQSLEEIEIIVVNDGSTDGSQRIIDKFASDFPKKIRAFQKENGGLSDARNYGLDRASGDFLGFVDSDDWVSQTMFEEMYFLSQKHRAEMVICNLQKVNDAGAVLQKLTQIPNMPEKIDLETHFSVFSDISYFACNKLFKKSLFEGMRFKKGIHFEDIELIPQLLLNCTTLAQTQNYHYHYLVRSGSISKTHTEKGLDILSAVDAVGLAFRNSRYKHHLSGMKNFQILEGVYTFLAYLAFVKDPSTYKKMSSELKGFVKENQINLKEILTFTRFGKNYLLYLSLGKKIYYLMYFFGLGNMLKKLLK